MVKRTKREALESIRSYAKSGFNNSHNLEGGYWALHYIIKICEEALEDEDPKPE